MKSDFDKLEAFRESLNALAKLNCNVSDAYDRERAAAELQRLSKAWHKDENYVILAVAQMAQSEVDDRLRYMVQQTAEMLQLPFSVEEFRKNWESLSKKEKIELVDSTIFALEGMRKEGK